MEQFSLEKYLANPSRKVVTRAGHSVRIICTDMNYKNHPIVALIAHDNGTENVYTYTKDGEWDNYESTTYDLFFAPEKDKKQRFNPKTLKPFDKVCNWLSDYLVCEHEILTKAGCESVINELRKALEE